MQSTADAPGCEPENWEIVRVSSSRKDKAIDSPQVITQDPPTDEGKKSKQDGLINTMMEKFNHILDFTLPSLDFPDGKLFSHAFLVPLLRTNMYMSGDTLVFINPHDPEDEVANTQKYPTIRIHSEKLLATRSTIFVDQLGATNQRRVTRRRKCWPLPAGIKYALDLSPPAEGDVAVNLTSDLSCPLGFRRWPQIAELFSIPPNLVGGLDNPHGMEEWESRSRRDTFRQPLDLWEQYVVTISARNTALKPQRNQAAKRRLSEVIREEKRLDYADNVVRVTIFDGEEEDTARTMAVVEPMVQPASIQVPLDYTALRHRTGIERVLTAIEGLDPKIDSAPKLWTLVGLAQYFDCATSIVDWTVSWIYAAPNSAIIEVVPEPCVRIAEILQNYTLCRDAFAILVGEDALARVGQQGPRSSSKRERLTILGRPREELDESFAARVEYAGVALHDRIRAIFDELTNPDLHWLSSIKEYQKILKLLPPDKSHFESDGQLEMLTRQLDFLLRTYITDTINGHLHNTIPLRLLPWTKGQHSLKGSDLVQSASYLALDPDQRILTRTFWSHLCDQLFSELTRDLRTSIDDLNDIDHPIYTQDVDSNSLGFEGVNPDIGASTQTSHAQVHEVVQFFNQHLISTHSTPVLDAGILVQVRPVLFRLPIFLMDVRRHVRSICSKVLQQNVSFMTLATDTLLCLEEEQEMKYLPLWAGGCDDGSGGVFDESIPNAIAGPTGPGPRLHVMDSEGGSAGSDYSMLRRERGSASVETSLMVDDGLSSHLDRRRVVAVPSVTDFSDSTWEDIDTPRHSISPSLVEKAIEDGPRDGIAQLALINSGEKSIVDGATPSDTRAVSVYAVTPDNKKHRVDVHEKFQTVDDDDDDDDDDGAFDEDDDEVIDPDDDGDNPIFTQ